MTLAELREEYLNPSMRIGPKIDSQVRDIVHSVARRYDPEIYGQAANWDDAEEDLVQSVELVLLLEEGQLDYLMATAVELEDFRNLLRRQVRRYLARQRKRSVIDNLLDRAKELLQAPFFTSSGAGHGIRYWAQGATVQEREPTEEEVLGAARAVSLVPRMRFSAHERAPAVYSREGFETVLQAVATSLPTSFSLHDLGRILELVLTDWVASFLYDFEEAHAMPSVALNPEEEMMVEAAAQEVLAGCSPEQLWVLRRKLENQSDQVIAEELSLSRPTVIARKQEAFDVMRGALGSLSEYSQRAAMDRISARLATIRQGPRS